MLSNTSVLPVADDPSRLSSRPHAWEIARCSPDKLSATHIETSPSGAVELQSMTGRSIRAELVQSMSRNRIDFRYRGRSHVRRQARRFGFCLQASCKPVYSATSP